MQLQSFAGTTIRYKGGNFSKDPCRPEPFAHHLNLFRPQEYRKLKTVNF